MNRVIIVPETSAIVLQVVSWRCFSGRLFRLKREVLLGTDNGEDARKSQTRHFAKPRRK